MKKGTAEALFSLFSSVWPHNTVESKVVDSGGWINTVLIFVALA